MVPAVIFDLSASRGSRAYSLPHSSTMAGLDNPMPSSPQRAVVALLLTAVVFVGAAVASLVHRDSRDEQITSLQRQLDELKPTRNSGGLLPHKSTTRSRSSNGNNAIWQSVSSPTCDCPSSFTYASDYGVVGDGQTDDAAALQMAIDAAASNLEAGGTVILPKGIFLTKSTLIIPGGIKVKGQGYGSSPLAIQFDAGSSVIAYCGTEYAVKFQGHASALEDVAVYDWRYPANGYCDSVEAAGGVLVEADGIGVESVTMSNVLIYWFLGEGAAALTVRAQNGGGIAYASFKDVRIRHAHTGILLTADDTSFVNSNSFFGGAISGGITEVALRAEGPGACNDNKVYGMVIEPPSTNLAHVYVTGPKTNVHLLDTRLEGTGMAQTKPLVIIDDSSYGNVMTGILGHTNIQADLARNPGIDFTSAKSVGVDPAPLNMLWNAAFHGYDSSTPSPSMAGWSLPGGNWNMVALPDSEALFADHQVLSIDYLNDGGPFKLSPDLLPKSPVHSFATFGIYARSTVAGSIAAAMRAESGSIISSSSHSGSGGWEFISMSALYDKTAPSFYFSITGDVTITAPTLVYGQTPATPGAEFLSSSGAKMSGTLSMGLTKAYPPDVDSSTPDFWVLPKNEGNYFDMDMQDNPSRTISRLNDSTADRFSKGTVVTLLFSEPGTTVKNNGYNELKGSDFVSTVNSSLTLISRGPTWTEVSRNN